MLKSEILQLLLIPMMVSLKISSQGDIRSSDASLNIQVCVAEYDPTYSLHHVVFPSVTSQY